MDTMDQHKLYCLDVLVIQLKKIISTNYRNNIILNINASNRKSRKSKE